MNVFNFVFLLAVIPNIGKFLVSEEYQNYILSIFSLATSTGVFVFVLTLVLFFFEVFGKDRLGILELIYQYKLKVSAALGVLTIFMVIYSFP